MKTIPDKSKAAGDYEPQEEWLQYDDDTALDEFDFSEKVQTVMQVSGCTVRLDKFYLLLFYLLFFCFL